MYISKENWFSEKGKFLNPTEVLKLRKEEIEDISTIKNIALYFLRVIFLRNSGNQH